MLVKPRAKTMEFEGGVTIARHSAIAKSFCNYSNFATRCILSTVGP